MKLRATVVLAAAFCFVRVANGQQAPVKPADAVASLADAPVNTWAKIVAAKTGGRDSALFVYAPNIKRFVAAAGMQSYGGEGPRHYDTEEFDLAATKWVNAYPPGRASSRPESGPVGPEYSKERAMAGHNGGGLFYKDGEFLRVGAGGQWLVTRTNYEWCYVPDNGRVYLYVHDRTLCYDPVNRTWEDTNATPRTSCNIWGSMAYDPVNKEIFHAGGDGGSAVVGTWVYSIEKNKWRMLEFGSDKAKALGDEAKKLCWQAKALLGAAANRFAVSETKEEAKADLKAKAITLREEAKRLLAQVKSADLNGAEKNSREAAVGRLDAAVLALGAVADKLSSTITPEAVGEVRAARVLIEQAIDALAVEPPGRARSQVAYDPVRKKMVLFGGDQLDRVLSDTWVYDCATRTWEQRFPKECPLPRAGHILAWLPKAKKVVLAGGYSRDWLAQQMWAYDVEANEWKMLLHIPLASEDWGRQQFSQNCPRVDARGPQTGAVNEDDVLVCINGANVWACKVDPGKPTSAPDGQTGAAGDYRFNRIDPAAWEKAANPDAARTKKFYEELPANQWTALKFARYAPGARNRWGTTAYDIDRHQLLFWG
ncbi:MAG: kelch repeat-containing protein, partial [Phycisphaerae bacterium]|nr:kelch repeat-containing protein [Phycisphaerae bacterium]